MVGILRDHYGSLHFTIPIILKANWYQLHDVVFPHPAFDDETRANQVTRLTATEWAQPAMGVTSVALLQILQMLGLDADQFGGSLGIPVVQKTLKTS